MECKHGTVAWLLAAAVTVVGCSSSAEPDEGSGSPRLVDAARVLPASQTSHATLSGRIQAAERTILSFEVAGRVEQLALEAGDRFEAGDVLAALDNSRHQLLHERSVAAEEEARTALRDADLTLQRQKALRQKGHASQASLDSADAAVARARARLESAVASRRLARRDLDQTALRAPFSGTVARRLVEQEQRIDASQGVVEVVSSRRGFEVLTHVPEGLVEQLRPGHSQVVSVPALDVQPLAAEILHIGSHSQSASMYPVLLRITDPPEGLRSGMTAEVTLTLAEPELPGVSARGVRVPLTALVHHRKGEPHVLRLDDNNRLMRVGVRVVSVGNAMATVTGELHPGESIVARGVEFVAAGETVAVLGQGPDRFH
ncbi:efflux RND transporter periplasmic adaptor subunit [Marinobacter sp. HN1S83]|uniref:efflux RND transporter periplasmic adaptor subunit n=1 Tax=Marinobacter sp. HN1S83 TaxID=3382301 RepID=UPI00387B8655